MKKKLGKRPKQSKPESTSPAQLQMLASRNKRRENRNGTGNNGNSYRAQVCGFRW